MFQVSAKNSNHKVFPRSITMFKLTILCCCIKLNIQKKKSVNEEDGACEEGLEITFNECHLTRFNVPRLKWCRRLKGRSK